MNKRHPVVYCVLAILLLAATSRKVCAAEGIQGPGTALIKRVVILPFSNYTDDPDAGSLVTGAVRKEMLKRGYVIVDEEAADDFLSKRRIRHTGTVTRVTAREMGKALYADAVMVGGVDLYEQGNDLIVGITARLISSKDGGILWAEHLSYSGWDYEGLLGLGVIESIDTLTSMVTKDLVGSVPAVTPGFGDLRPFEAASVNVSPSRARSGDAIRLKVKVTAITGEPVLVKAVVDSKDVSLSDAGDGYYEGVVDAPRGEGLYPVDVIAYDRDMNSFSFKACGKISIDNTSPKVALMVDRKAIAPRRKGFVLFTPVLKDVAAIDEWAIEISDGAGNLVRSDGGFGKLPKKLVWKGETNNARLVDDGEYRIRFIVKDAAGNASVLSDTVRVKNSPPDVQVDARLVDETLVFTFALTARYENEAIDVWKVTISDDKGTLLESFNGKGGLPPRLEYPVEEGFDLNSISFSVTVTDEAGNPFEFKKALKTFALRNNPFAKMDRKERTIVDF